MDFNDFMEPVKEQVLSMEIKSVGTHIKIKGFDISLVLESVDLDNLVGTWRVEVLKDGIMAENTFKSYLTLIEGISNDKLFYTIYKTAIMWEQDHMAKDFGRGNYTQLIKMFDTMKFSLVGDMLKELSEKWEVTFNGYHDLIKYLEEIECLKE